PLDCIIVGGLHGPLKFSPPRHVITPRPYWPATMKPPFFTEGRTMTHSALFRTLMGTPLGELRSSFITLPDSLTRSCSCSLSAAIVSVGISKHRMEMASRTSRFSLEHHRFNIPSS